MKQLGRLLGNAFAAALTVFSLHAAAETQMAGRDFNHMATGFPLVGVHAAAACETCHVAGVFKGTARACDGCHALGKRVVATPKSTSHIVTDAPCDTCHFNASTFLGARYNHGNAVPGQCTTCHNGRIITGRPANHNSGRKVTDSCDHCHRSYTWLPASWNHIGVAPGTCTNCHIPGGQSTVSKPAGHTTVAKNTYQCDDCHSMFAWFPARYKHNTAAACSSCHNGTIAMGPASSHTSFPSWPTECNQCHFTNVSWLGALGAKPGNHIPYNAGATCTSCHTGLAKVSVSVLHANSVATYTCANCHITPNSYTGNNQKTRSSHDGSSGNNCTTACHEHSRAASYGGW
ncbi:MAG: hypothetical protein WAW02_14495 [Sideroxyarcus sp.]